MNTKKIKIPFLYGTHRNNDNGGLPHLLEFKYQYDNYLKLFFQVGSKKLDFLLNKIYSEGSMLDGEMNSQHGGQQGKAAVEFIDNNFPEIIGKEVLEIGCGNGFILNNLANCGAKCTGLEPGPQINNINNKTITKIKDFFPTKKLNNNFDLIISFNVLEHLRDPISSLKEQANHLKEKGEIIFGVPNCEPDINMGDISMFTHEHFNYFTRENLNKVIKKAGLNVRKLQLGAKNGMIFGIITKTKYKNSIDESILPKTIKLDDFQKKNKLIKNKIKNILKDFSEKDVALYAPKRALNIMSALKLNSFRLVDDTPSMLYKYLPYFNKRIENFEDLENSPPKLIIIFTKTFSNIIANKCMKSSSLKNTKIIQLKELIT